MALSSSVVWLLAALLLLGLVRAEARQQPGAASYPAAGFRPARQFGLPAVQPKPARLVANSEAREDLDDAAEEVEVEVTPDRAAPAPAPLPAVPLTPTIAYYPAGAVGFVRPATFAKVIAAPLQTTAFAATPQYYPAYLG
ncbi:uncharacterized protein LOC108088760 [Drosophila ficusphila]|uniref:uncharacterized protein LOC108088760 n=1 Tax=Drosophila ficusphila TaxID=30025 RepID=UPI0007E8628B|nr:uncharacterized protein LOC108088760 [Drosophila ficusphila]